MLKIEKGIFCTAIPEHRGEKVAPADLVVNMIQHHPGADVRREEAVHHRDRSRHAATTSLTVISTRGYAARRMGRAIAARVRLGVSAGGRRPLRPRRHLADLRNRARIRSDRNPEQVRTKISDGAHPDDNARQACEQGLICCEGSESASHRVNLLTDNCGQTIRSG
jgi:hypothetical protein